MNDWFCPYMSGSLLKLYIRPGASSSGIVGLHDTRLKIRIKSPPRDGEANEELLVFLSGLLRISKKEIEIIRGESGRSKDVFVNLPPEKIKASVPELF